MIRVRHTQMYQDLLKSCHHNKKGRLLGLDVGDKYVGLAVSGANNKVASPLSVLVRTKTNMDLMATDFQKLVTKFCLVGLIIGYPFDRIQNNPAAASVHGLIHELSKTGKLDGVKYTFWDECFTSKSVDCLLRPLKLHSVQAKTIMDKFAAVNILQGYLDFVNRSQGQAQKIQIINRQSLYKEISDSESEST